MLAGGVWRGLGWGKNNPIWDYFDTVITGDPMNPSTMTICNLCGRKFSFKNHTRSFNLIRHLDRKHNEELKNYIEKRNQIISIKQRLQFNCIRSTLSKNNDSDEKIC